MIDIENATPLQLEVELASLADSANELSVTWYEKKDEYEIKHKSREDILAAITHESFGGSNTEKERNARRSTQWKEFMVDHDILKQESSKATVEKENAIRSWDTIRSIMSSRNTERRTVT